MNKYDEAKEHIIDMGIPSSGSTSIDRRITKTLKEALEKAKAFEEMVEARKKATRGEFTLEKVKPEDGFDECLITFGGTLKMDNYQYSAWQTIRKNDAEFIVHAANLTEKYIKE